MTEGRDQRRKDCVLTSHLPALQVHRTTAMLKKTVEEACRFDTQQETLAEGIINGVLTSVFWHSLR
jgi:hypothetical protein